MIGLVKTVARGVLFDLDGTIYEGTSLIEGASMALEFCSAKGIPHRFVTNTTSKPRSEVVKKLRGLGVDAREDWVFTAPAAARDILVRRGFLRCHLMLREPLLADLDGVAHVDDAPQAVVIGDLGDGFSYERLNRAFQLLLDDQCAFITLAKNRCFKSESGLNLDVGAFVAALEYATGRRSELVGKPAKSFFDVAAASMGLQPGEVMMVGDDLESDALGAQAAGLQGVLVRTGKFRESQLAQSDHKPDAVWDSVADLIENL